MNNIFNFFTRSKRQPQNALIINHLLTIQNQLRRIMGTQTEVAEQITALKAQIEKVSTEVQGKLQELETAINDQGDASPEVEAALAGLKTAVQGVDDLIPDAPAGQPQAAPTEDEGAE